MKNILFSIFLTCFFVGYAQSDFSTSSSVSTQELLMRLNNLGNQTGDVSSFFSKAEMSQLQQYFQTQNKMNVSFGGQDFSVTGGASTGYGVETQADGFMTFDPVTGSGITSISAGSGTAGFEGAGAISNDDPTTGYAIDTNGVLYSINVATGAYTNEGNVGILNMNGMEFNPADGTLYAITATDLYTIDVDAASATLVGSLGIAGTPLAIALAIDGDGTGYTYDIATDTFYSINLATGAATLIGSTGFDGNFGQGMCWDSSTDTVYMAAFNNTTFMAEWRSVNTATGMSTLVGNMVGTGALTQVAWVSTLGESTPAEGCLDAENGQYPSGAAFVPACLGVPQDITTLGWTGEYSLVAVNSGTEYIFSVSDPTYFITIGDEAGVTVITSGSGSVTWTANMTGNVRFYTHFNSDCDWDAETFLTRSIQCGDIPPPPEGCEDQNVPSNNLENGLFFGGDTDQLLAVDVIVGDTGFPVYGVDLNVFIDGNTDLTFSATFYEDDGGLPGAVHATTAGTVSSSELVGNAFGFDVWNYVVAFDTTVNLDANTTYWMQIESDGVAWEATSAFILGSGLVFSNTNTSGAWTVDPITELVYSLVCEPLGVSDMNAFDFAYYPNPVKDVLNIDAKQAITKVSVSNMAGQQVINKAEVTNGQIDVTSLAPGVYVFRVTLEGGQVETFKIIKK